MGCHKYGGVGGGWQACVFTSASVTAAWMRPGLDTTQGASVAHWVSVSRACIGVQAASGLYSRLVGQACMPSSGVTSEARYDDSMTLAAAAGPVVSVGCLCSVRVQLPLGGCVPSAASGPHPTRAGVVIEMVG